MNMTEMMRSPRSVRTFDGKALREEDAASILAFAEKVENPYELPFDKPLLVENAEELQSALELVRLAPSAVNGQPWRVVRCGDRVHFYEKRGRGMASDTWDIQKIDMGIALCHFELGAVESGLCPVLYVEDPGLPGQDGLIYIASFKIK